jgi:hypothetical protein
MNGKSHLIWATDRMQLSVIRTPPMENNMIYMSRKEKKLQRFTSFTISLGKSKLKRTTSRLSVDRQPRDERGTL